MPLRREALLAVFLELYLDILCIRADTCGEYARITLRAPRGWQPAPFADYARAVPSDGGPPVGGLTRYAAGNDTVLIRTAQGEQSTYSVHLNNLIRDGDIDSNVALRPGDILIIPQRLF